MQCIRLVLSGTGGVTSNVTAEEADTAFESTEPQALSSIIHSTPFLVNSRPEFYMKRDPKMTLSQLWAEYTVGLDGNPAIRDLEAQGTDWRKNQNEAGYFRKRRTIIREIEAMIESGLTEEAAINVMEQRRGNKTIDWLIKEMRRQRNSN